MTMAISSVVGFPLALVAVFAPNRTLFIVLATLAVYLFTFTTPCIGPLIHQVVRPNLRATAMALYLLVVHVLGYAVAPAFIGWLSDRTGDLRLGVVVAPLVALASGLVGLWGARFVGGDERAMRERLRAEAH